MRVVGGGLETGDGVLTGSLRSLGLDAGLLSGLVGFRVLLGRGGLAVGLRLLSSSLGLGSLLGGCSLLSLLHLLSSLLGGLLLLGVLLLLKLLLALLVLEDLHASLVDKEVELLKRLGHDVAGLEEGLELDGSGDDGVVARLESGCFLGLDLELGLDRDLGGLLFLELLLKLLNLMVGTQLAGR